MVVLINDRPVYVADSRKARVQRAMKRKNHSIARELKIAGLLPRNAGNALAFQTGSDYYYESQTDLTVVRTSPRERPESHISHTVKFSK